MDYTSYGFEDSLRTVFRRCVICPDTTPTCPDCADDEFCSQISPSCTQCAARACVKIDSAGTVNAGPIDPPLSSGGTNTGVIAGGAIGGVAFIAIATYLIWRFCIKNRRRSEDDDEFFKEKANSISARSNTNNRASTHTVASMASTVMTRASNVIQIAFIPGITDRSQEGGHGSVPPVPAIPLQHQTNSPTSPYVDSPKAHYFMPRDSTYTGISDSDSIRSSMIRQSVAQSTMARQSVTPSLARQSYASTIFHQDAAVSITPAQTAYRGKANMVSVRPSAGSTPNGGIPEVPQVDYFKYNPSGSRPLQRTHSMAPSIAPSLAPSVAFSDTASMRNAIFSSTTAAAAGYPTHPPLSDEDKRKTTDSTRIVAAMTAAAATKPPPMPSNLRPPPQQRPAQQRSSPTASSSDSPPPSRAQAEENNESKTTGPSPFADENAVSR